MQECLDSVLRQTLDNIEVICVDDSSTDSSLQILKDYAAKDGRIKILTQEDNRFAGAARNRGIEVAAGKYLAFWDSDDFFEPEALELMYLQCEQDEADMCVCKARTYDMASRRILPVDFYMNIRALPCEIPFSARNHPDIAFMFCSPSPWNKLFKREFVMDSGLRFQEVKRGNDLFFVFMAITLAKKITAIDRILVNYRTLTATSLQETIDDDPFYFYEPLKAFGDELKKRGLFSVFEKSYINRCLSVCLYNLSIAKTKEAWLAIALKLKDEILPALGCDIFPEAEYINPDQYEQMSFILHSTKEDLAAYEPELRRDEKNSAAAAEISTVEAGGEVGMSVIITGGNEGGYLAECLRSVMRQSMKNIEIICVSDGSDEGAADMIEVLRGEDDRIKLCKARGSGLSAAGNAGIDNAAGEYILFMESKDCLAWCAIEHTYREAKRHDLDLLFYGGEVFYEPIELFQPCSSYLERFRYKQAYEPVSDGRELFARLMGNDDFKPFVTGLAIRRSFLKDNKLGFEIGIGQGDALFALQCAMCAERSKVLNEPLYQKRVCPDSVSEGKEGWDSVYGYFICAREIRKALINDVNDKNILRKALPVYLTLISRAAVAVLKNMEKEDARSKFEELPFDEQNEFALHFEYIQREAAASASGAARAIKLANLNGRLKVEREKTGRLKMESDRLRRSVPYRLGRFIASPLSLLRRLRRRNDTC